MRTEADVEQTIETYADMVKHICLVYMKNTSEAEDIFQDVFLKYALFSESFESEEHKKAWLIRVTVNRCKDVLKSFFRSHVYSIEQVVETSYLDDQESRMVLDAVSRLPEAYRIAIYLHYYEGYTAAEIGKLLKMKENTVYSNLSRGRDRLKKMLGGEEVG